RRYPAHGQQTDDMGLHGPGVAADHMPAQSFYGGRHPRPTETFVIFAPAAQPVFQGKFNERESRVAAIGMQAFYRGYFHVFPQSWALRRSNNTKVIKRALP